MIFFGDPFNNEGNGQAIAGRFLFVLVLVTMGNKGINLMGSIPAIYVSMSDSQLSLRQMRGAGIPDLSVRAGKP
jgi:hypothetical protein